MSYLGIGSQIPTLKNLRELEVTLDYPVANACEQDSTVIPSIKEPAGGTFSATPSGLSIDSNGVITPGSSTVGNYVISYTVNGLVGNFDFEIVADKASGFNYGGSTLQQSGYVTPTFNSGVQTGGIFEYTSSTGGTLSITQNQSSPYNGKIDLSNSSIGSYSISYASPGPCSTTTTISLQIVSPYASTSSFYFDGNSVFSLDASFDVTGGLTLSCWVKYSASNNSLVYWITNGSTAGPGNILTTRFSGNSWFNLINGSPVYTGVSGLGDNNWHHIAQTINYSNGDVKYYKDGVQSSNTYTFGSGMTTAIIRNIGALNNTGTYGYNGLIDEFAVFESIVDISDLWNSGKPGDLTSLNPALWYKMGE